MSGIFMLASVLLYVFGFIKLSFVFALPSVFMIAAMSMKEWYSGVVIAIVSALIKIYLFKPDKDWLDAIIGYTISVNMALMLLSILMLFVPLSIGIGQSIFKRNNR